ncbi:hypothetical protein AB1Y20_008345 [Prymnesium parvum]|uniref:PIPK domain-containing protein n=1 Tax=Prymnesium parvum TaxID=97485 RepID=A0AB34IUL1_PRYPA
MSSAGWRSRLLSVISSKSSKASCSHDDDSSAPLSASARSRWTALGHRISLGLLLNSKVSVANKVGVRPTGEDAEVALALHRGIGAALRDDPPPTSPRGAPRGRVVAVEPALFARVRQTLGIAAQSFHASLALQEGLSSSNFAMVPTPGRSGAYFFLSPDQYYMLKVMSAADFRCLRRLLKRYADHLDAHPGSLLPRYVAVFELHGLSRSPIRFVCMTNVFSGVHEIQRKYDLKGSTKNRQASRDERSRGAHAVLKDLDWLLDGKTLAQHRASAVASSPSSVVRSAADGSAGASSPLRELSSVHSGGSKKLERRRSSMLTAHTSTTFMLALAKDVTFLYEARLIDYSLLVGIHTREEGTNYTRLERSPGRVVIETETEVMYVCLVDILTPYGCRKHLETFFKSTIRGGRDISCKPPLLYAERFLNFIDRQA